MIEVRVRQQDCVNVRQVMKMKRWCGQAFRADGKTWQTNSDTWKEDGVCQNCDAKKIYKHCGMPQPGKCQLRVAPFRRLGFRKGRGDWPPAFNRPFMEQMPEPTPRSGSARDWLLRCVHLGT